MEGPTSAAIVQALACPLCGKTYSQGRCLQFQDHSLRRHVSYCRRAQTKRKGRPKSCVACNASKTKCSFARPRCHRCEAKGLECVYGQSTQRRIAPEDDGNRRVPNTPFPLDPKDQEPIWTTVLPTGDPIEAVPLPLDFNDPIIDLEDEAPESHVDLAGHTGGGSQWSADPSGPQLSLSSASHWPSGQRTQSSLVTSPYHDVVTRSRATTSLTHLRQGNPASKHAASLIIHIICAFPQMMLRRQTFPPFIHACWHLPAIPEKLASCMSIAQLFASRTPETRPFLWRMIDNEQQRFIDTLETEPAQELQYMVQANIIYIIMGIIDQDSDSPARGARMIETFKALCTRFRDLLGTEFFSDYEQARPSATWEDWIFAETRRRIMWLWFIISRVVSAQAELPCAQFYGYVHLPVVSNKTLWEARSGDEWAAEKALYDMGSPPTTFGEIIEAKARPNDPLMARRLDAWEAGVDKLGMLINIATALA